MEAKLTTEQREHFFSKINAKSDNIMKYVLMGCFLLGVGLSVFYNTLILSIVSGGLCIAAYFLSKAIFPKFRLYQYVGSAALAVFAAQFIYQTHGLQELHFVIFIGAAVLISYQNWKLQLPLVLIPVIHYSWLVYLQNSGSKEVYISQMDQISLTAYLFHMAFVISVSTLCGYWAHQWETQTASAALKSVDMDAQLTSIKNNIGFANEISKGNLTVDYQLLNESDELGLSLLTMRKNLVEAAQREQEEKFITIGITKVGDIIRNNNDNVKKLADEFVSGIVKYLGINQGALFLHEKNDNDEYLDMVACYAYERKKFLSKRVALGEGLVGQCFLEKEEIYMTTVPDSYAVITSGLGGATPGSVLLMPLLTNETIVGVLELAAFKPFSEAHIQFIKRAAENIASSIVSSRITERVKGLLQESQQQTEEMKAQEEEMRQNMEELQATQEGMSRKNLEVEKLLAQTTQKEAELQKQLEEVSTMKKEELRKSQEQLQYIDNYKKTLLGVLDHLPHKIFLKDQDGKMVLVNTAVAKAHHMSVDELIGKSDFDFVDAATAQEWRNQELAIVKKGSESYTHKDSIGGETRTLKTVKSAFYIPHLNQTGLLGVQTDITDQVNAS
jgi:methyl-accepting chemotaxis protein